MGGYLKEYAEYMYFESFWKFFNSAWSGQQWLDGPITIYTLSIEVRVIWELLSL